MTKKEYLSDMLRLDRHIRFTTEEIKRLNESLQSYLVASKNIEKVIPSVDPSMGYFETFKMLYIKMNENLKKSIEKQTKVFTAIEKVESSKHKMLLELRYLEHQTWEDIALIMKYSTRQVMRLHDEAIEMLDLETPE